MLIIIKVAGKSLMDFDFGHIQTADIRVGPTIPNISMSDLTFLK